MNQFFDSLGVECTPRCGSCKCGKCHTGGSNMTIKEEREYELIEKGLTYLPDQERWTAKLPWIKDPFLLSNNKAINGKKTQ